MSGCVIAAVVIAIVIAVALATTLVLSLIYCYKHKKWHVGVQDPVTHAEEASTNSSKAAPRQGS